MLARTASMIAKSLHGLAHRLAAALLNSLCRFLNNPQKHVTSCLELGTAFLLSLVFKSTSQAQGPQELQRSSPTLKRSQQHQHPRDLGPAQLAKNYTFEGRVSEGKHVKLGSCAFQGCLRPNMGT
jgi:hypothetical protein